MKIAIMQPYLFPYIGYFQLMNSVDCFVIYDDVQYIKRGWINRNNILLNNNAHLFSFSVNQDSQQTNINQRKYSPQMPAEVAKFFITLEHSYKRAPFYDNTIKLLRNVFHSVDMNVAGFNGRQLKIIANYLGMDTKFRFSSEIDMASELKGKERIVEICRRLRADQYINAIGGQGLYSKDHFQKAGITLSFLQTENISYKQFDNSFVSYLSIIDVLMFNSKEDIVKLLLAHTLL